jgi:hypothetical protein
VPFRGVWLEAPAATLARRIDARTHDPSDATAAVLAAQVARGCGPLAWHRLAADRPLAALRADILSLCGDRGATEMQPPAVRTAPIPTD